jgi:hypothetical protein
MNFIDTILGDREKTIGRIVSFDRSYSRLTGSGVVPKMRQIDTKLNDLAESTSAEPRRSAAAPQARCRYDLRGCGYTEPLQAGSS